jgi:hypothetical protein
MAKSLGYGKVTIAVKEKESGLKYPLEDYLKAFEELLEVNGDLKIQDWSQHKAYCELMTMASEQPGRKIPLEHMELKDFREVKNNKGWLQPYSNLPGVRKKCPGTYLTKEDRNKKFINRANELAKERLKTEEAIKKREEDLKKQQEEKIKAEEAARREKAEELKNKGLGAMLDESVADEFNKVRGRVDNYLKKVGKLNVDDIQNILYPKIKACFEKEKIKPRTLKPWQGEINQSPVWKKVSSWVGEDLARKWKQEMMGEEV